jgi:hypothetical protein
MSAEIGLEKHTMDIVWDDKAWTNGH